MRFHSIHTHTLSGIQFAYISCRRWLSRYYRWERMRFEYTLHTGFEYSLNIGFGYSRHISPACNSRTSFACRRRTGLVYIALLHDDALVGQVGLKPNLRATIYTYKENLPYS